MFTSLLVAAFVAAAPSASVPTLKPPPRAVNADLYGRITDSIYRKPLQGADIVVRRGASEIERTTSDQFGSWRIHDLTPADYTVEFRLIGYRPETRTVTIGGSSADVELDLVMAPQAVTLNAISVTASPVAVDTRTGDQIFKENDYQGTPTQTTSQIVQQSIAGAARAPTGEVHIRGQHGEYTYYVDGVPVPPGISGSLNELFDPSVVNQITFQTGAWDAEYGKRNAAIINVETKVPAGPYHFSVTGYAGDYSSNGQTVTMSANSGKLGYFLSGTRQSTAMRREPVVATSDAAGDVTGLDNFSNNGTDWFGFGKLQYVATDHDLVNLDVNLSRSNFATPFDSADGVINDQETDLNHFINLSYDHKQVGGSHDGSEAFIATYYRHGGLDYVPGLTDDPSFFFYPDTSTAYNIAENRSFNIYGVKADYLLRFSERLNFKAGTDVALTRGAEAFSTRDASGNPGPASNSDLNGNDEAFYLQSVIQPTEKVEFRVGARYDRHAYPLSATKDSTASQVSPRFRVTYFPNTGTSMWFYYGRLFIPTNTEDLRAITQAATGGATEEPTVPERDDFFEVGLTHRFTNGLAVKLSGYHKKSEPGIDDTQLPGSAITTDVNIEHVRITGIEAVLDVHPAGPVSGFANIALNHAYGFGAITGAFLETTPPAEAFDLDHDQRLSSTVGLTYSDHGVLLNAIGIYGSGLTNGVTPNAPGVDGYDPTQPSTPVLGTGLFDFNSPFKVDPSFILNLSGGYSFSAGGWSVQPQLFVDNVFDKLYILKGAFFSGPSFGRPRTFNVRLTLGI